MSHRAFKTWRQIESEWAPVLEFFPQQCRRASGPVFFSYGAGSLREDSGFVEMVEELFCPGESHNVWRTGPGCRREPPAAARLRLARGVAGALLLFTVVVDPERPGDVRGHRWTSFFFHRHGGSRHRLAAAQSKLSRRKLSKRFVKNFELLKYGATPFAPLIAPVPPRICSNPFGEHVRGRRFDVR